jgi:hypothetical protein
MQFRQVQMNSSIDHLAQMQVQSDGGKQRDSRTTDGAEKSTVVPGTNPGNKE